MTHLDDAGSPSSPSPETSGVAVAPREGLSPAQLRRLLARRTQRGNALFVVVMVMTLLTAVGVVSMRAASLAQQATGFNRQGVQAGYVSEFAARSVMTELVGKEQHYFRYIAAGGDDCRANRQLATVMSPDRPSCYRLESSEVWGRVNAAFPGNVGSSSAELLGTLSRAETDAAFIVEMTDLARAGGPIVGEDVAMDQFKFMQVLMTATAQVRPRLSASDEDEDEDEEATAPTCDDSLSQTSGLQSLRAQVTFGPVN
jgi:hypothetical protein